MKDLPMFMTENGAASLILREIPYQGIAYVMIRDSRQPEKLLEDCISICRAAGAESIYASGDAILNRYPFHTKIMRMCCKMDAVGDTCATLCPVQEQTVGMWMELYNKKISQIPNAAWMTHREAQHMLTAGEGYFVYRDEELIGLGRVEGKCLRFVASVKQGAGADVVRTLCRAVSSDIVQLDVASTNIKAIQLYEKLGFAISEELSCWYRVV